MLLRDTVALTRRVDVRELVVVAVDDFVWVGREREAVAAVEPDGLCVTASVLVLDGETV